MIAIACYITAHGYGHAVRCREVMRALKSARPDVQMHVRSAVTERFFRDVGFPVSHHQRAVDVGFVQRDGLEMDAIATLGACRDFQSRLPKLLREEAAFVRKEKIDLILGDIPPLAFEVGARARVPSVAIANFTWDWIYRWYFAEDRSFLPVIEAMESFYRRATLALELPFSAEMSAFEKTEAVPLIARTSPLSREEARKSFALPAEAPIVLLHFGGFGLARFAWQKLERLGECFFVSTNPVPETGKNFRLLPEALPNYLDLVRAADAVVTKPGYGIMAEIIAHRVPALYTSRGQFPEYPYLVRALTEWATSEFIPQESLLEGDLGPYLERLLSKRPNWPAVPLNGAEVAAERALALL